MKNLFLILFCGWIVAATNVNAQTWDCGTTTPSTVFATLDGGTLTIWGTGAMANYTASNMPWAEVRASITAVVIESGVTQIGNNAFNGCTSLATVTIQDGTGLLNFGNTSPNRVFEDCPIQTLYMGRNFTSPGVSPFRGNTTLETVTVGGYVTELLGNLFSGCIRLATVDVNVTSISVASNAFEYCSALTDNVVNEMLKKMTAIATYTFRGCTELTHIIIPNSITSIAQNAFSGCSKVATVTIQDGTGLLNFGNTSPNRVFENCPIQTLYMGRNFTSPGVSPFRGNTTLETVTLGGYVNALYGSLFSGCTRLAAVNVNVTSISVGANAFEYCSALTDNVVNEMLKKMTSIATYTFRGCTELTHIIIPNSITSIAQYAFSGCSKLATVVIQDGTGLLNFGNVSPNRAFENCPIQTLYMGRNFTSPGTSPFSGKTTLEEVTIGSEVTTLGANLFNGCTWLATFIIADGTTTLSFGTAATCTVLTGCPIKTLYMGRNISYGTAATASPFYNKTALETVTVGGSVSALGSLLFAGCTGITAFILLEGPAPLDFGTADVNMVFPVSPIEKLYLGRNISYGTAVTASPFYNKTELETVTLGDDLTALGNYMFSGCTSLSEVNINSSLSAVGDYAFLNCQALIDFSVNDILDMISAISAGTFSGNEGLEAVVIPANVTFIGADAFSGCTNLMHITSLSATPPVIQENSFQDVPKTGNTLILPQGAEADYWATRWQELMSDYHRIDYHAEGGAVSPAIRYVRNGDALGIIPTPERNNYEFDGWFTQQDGEGTEYTVATVVTASANLYANWIYDGIGMVVSITVSPASVAVQKTKTQQFTANVTVEGDAPTTVTWTVTGVAATSITEAGLLTIAAGETASTLTVTATSTFDATKTGVATVTVENLTNAEDLFAPELNIYPNPFTGEVRITGAVIETRYATSLRIINAAGTVVHTQIITNPDETIRLEHLPAGIYFFRLETDGQTKTVKIVKN